jgi:hypothetical protein
MTPELPPLGPHTSNAFAFVPGLPSFDSWAFFLLTPATLQPLALVASPKLRLRQMRTRVDHSVWDRPLFPNPHALGIYLEFVPARGVAPERFEECQCEDDDVRLHCRTWVPGDGHYRWLRARSTHFP